MVSYLMVFLAVSVLKQMVADVGVVPQISLTPFGIVRPCVQPVRKALQCGILFALPLHDREGTRCCNQLKATLILNLRVALRRLMKAIQCRMRVEDEWITETNRTMHLSVKERYYT